MVGGFRNRAADPAERPEIALELCRAPDQPRSARAPPGASGSARSSGCGSGCVAGRPRRSPERQALIKYLEANQGSAKYLLAATGSQTTAPIIIATGRDVVTIGGFNGSDPTPSVSQLAQMVQDGELKYVLVSSGGGAAVRAAAGGARNR